MLPVPFCAMQSINDHHYLPRDKKSRDAQWLRPKGASVNLKAADRMSRGIFRKQQAQHTGPLRSFRTDEKLSVDFTTGSLVKYPSIKDLYKHSK